jgi:hypothetical protein
MQAKVQDGLLPRLRDERGETTRLRRPVVVEKLRWRHHMCAEEWSYLRARTRQPAKVTLISAQQAAAYYDPEKSRAAYPTCGAFGPWLRNRQDPVFAGRSLTTE